MKRIPIRKIRLIPAITGVLALVFLGFISCADPGIIGYKGGTVTSSDGKLTIIIPPGALSENDGEFKFTIEKTDASALTGSIGNAYAVEPSGLLFRKPITLVYDYTGIELGDNSTTSLCVSFFGNNIPIPLKSTLNTASNTLTATVTHLTTFGLSRSTPLTTLNAVKNIITSAYVKVFWSPYFFVTGPETTLTSTDTVSPADGQETEDLMGVPEMNDPNQYNFENDTWFFWVDLLPDNKFAHQNIYLFADKETGAFQEAVEFWWPVINGTDFMLDTEERFNSDLTIYKMADHYDEDTEFIPPITEETVSSSSRTHKNYSRTILNLIPESGTAAESEEDCCEGDRALILQLANKPDVFQADADAMHAYATSSTGMNLSAGDASKSRATTPAELTTRLNSLILPEGKCWCNVFIYLTTHGSESGFGIYKDNGTKTGRFNWADLLVELNKICVKNNFTVVMDTCHSGGFKNSITNARKWINNQTGAAKTKAVQDFPYYLCANMDIINSVRSDRSASGIPGEMSFFVSTFLYTLKFRTDELDSSTDFTGAIDQLNDDLDNHEVYQFGESSEKKKGMKHQGASHQNFEKEDIGEDCECEECCPDNGTSTGFDPEDLTGSYLFNIDSKDDPAGHAPYIGTSIFTQAIVLNIISSTVYLTGPAPFVAVSGAFTSTRTDKMEIADYQINTDNSISFTATGSGTVAGFSDVGVSMTMTITEEGDASGAYTMGTGGELYGQDIVYYISGSLQ